MRAEHGSHAGRHQKSKTPGHSHRAPVHEAKDAEVSSSILILGMAPAIGEDAKLAGRPDLVASAARSDFS